jgi:hypothetical protein
MLWERTIDLAMLKTAITTEHAGKAESCRHARLALHVLEGAGSQVHLISFHTLVIPVHRASAVALGQGCTDKLQS